MRASPKPDGAHFRNVLRACRSMDAQNIIAAQKQIIIAVYITMVQPVMSGQIFEIGRSRQYSYHDWPLFHHGAIRHVQIWVNELRE